MQDDQYDQDNWNNYDDCYHLDKEGDGDESDDQDDWMSGIIRMTGTTRINGITEMNWMTRVTDIHCNLID